MSPPIRSLMAGQLYQRGCIKHGSIAQACRADGVGRRTGVGCGGGINSTRLHHLFLKQKSWIGCSVPVEALTRHVERLSRWIPVRLSVMTESARLGAGLSKRCQGFQTTGSIASGGRHRVAFVHDAYARRARHDAGQNPQYDDVMSGVRHFFDDRLTACEAAGIARERVILIPALDSAKPPNTTFTFWRTGETCVWMGTLSWWDCLESR